jgi:SPW repeat-containing protein
LTGRPTKLLSFLWTDTDNAAMWTMVALGALVALDGLTSLAAPGRVLGEGMQIVLGALMFISPWVTNYIDLSGIAWSSWILGGLTVVVGAVALPVARAAHRSGVAGQH